MKLLNCTYDEMRALSIRVKAMKLDTIRALDSSSNRLIDHLCECLDCLMTIIKHRGALCDSGCADFLNLLRQEGGQIDLQRSPLANLHATEEIIEEYCFNRLSPIEVKAFEAHLTVCRDCSFRLEHRKQFIALIKSALTQKKNQRPQGVVGVFGFDEETRRTKEVSVYGLV